MAQRAPDWLLNMASESPQLVEDSPSYRQDEARQQKANIRKATESTFDILAERREADLARQRAQERAMQEAENPTPIETRTGTPRDFGPYEPPVEYTGVEDYEPANPSVRPPSPIGPPLSAPDVVTPSILAQREMLPMPDDDPSNDELAGDPAEEVSLLSDMLGMPQEDIATLALLGEWGKRNEDREHAAGIPVGRASISPGDVIAAGRPSPPPTGSGGPHVPPPLGGNSINLAPPLTALPPELPPMLSGPPPEASPLPPGPPPA